MAAMTLVLNAGSSSLKFCVYRQDAGVAARGQIEGIGTAPRLTVKNGEGAKFLDERLADTVDDGRAAVEALSEWLRATFEGGRLLGVGHRVVHGGPRFDRPTPVSRDILAELKNLTPLAPLHQPHNLAPIETLLERMPNVPQIACFDTSFHRGHSPVATIVPLPKDLRTDGLERYGFHGISYEYIASVLPDVAPAIAKGRVVVAHLGSGASLCALKDGRSVDTTMSFTALDGLCMGTRPGAIDPGVVLYLFQNRGMSVEQVEDVLYKKSGLLGISGVSNDMRVLLASESPDAKLAVDYFVYRAAKEIGALAAVLGGLDALVFTAGIGENSPEVRRRIGDACGWLGVRLDDGANERGGPRISTADSKGSAWVVPTNEELMIARHTWSLLGLSHQETRP